jgi:prepilin-type N-terminal cleavage/methylation domain-containing protein
MGLIFGNQGLFRIALKNSPSISEKLVMKRSLVLLTVRGKILMKFATPIRSQKGFSLVELMIVVGIIGILSTLALPRFKQFQAKAKMAEAKTVLAHLFTMEQTYALDNNTYIAMDATGAILGASVGGVNCTPEAGSAAEKLAFRVDPCTNGGNSPLPRYSYSVPAATVTSSTFVAVATSGDGLNNRVCPGNPTHTVSINEKNEITNTPAAIGAACPN